MTFLSETDRELAFFARRFGEPKEDLLKFVEYYNSDFSAYDNHVYEHIGSRIAHWQNFERNDWFARRIHLYLDILEKLTANPQCRTTVVDIGFSVPYVYSRQILVGRANLSSVLIDKERSAKRFHSAIADLRGVKRNALHKVIVADIEIVHEQQRIWNALHSLSAATPPNTVLIVASEVIEHLDEPTSFWKLLEGIRIPGSPQILVYATLPVGKKIPSHTMEFLTSSDAFDYLSRHVQIWEKTLLRPPDRGNVSPYLKECVCVFGGLRRYVMLRGARNAVDHIRYGVPVAAWDPNCL